MSATGRLVLLVTSPRVAPGLLTFDAWDALRAGRVLAADAAHPLAAPLAAAGVGLAAVAPDARALIELATDSDVPIVWLVSPGGDAELMESVAAVIGERAAGGEAVPEVEALHGAYDVPGSRVLDLVAVMDRLRSPGGCPWDAAQTHRSLATYLLEETYETLEAIETGDDADLVEELGDLLLQVVFHARIGQEHADRPWDIDDVAAGIVQKLVHRHPHVFGGPEDAEASLESLDTLWEQRKAAEKSRVSSMDGVPIAQPALSLATKLMHRAEKAGVPVTVQALPGDAEIGDLLLSAVAAARARGVDAEQALRDRARLFVQQVRAAETDR